MRNKLKTRFDYDNPETCLLAVTYAMENGLCPECKSNVEIDGLLEGDLFIVNVECPKCKIKLEWGSFLDNSPEANDVRKSFEVNP
jgi:hydrogenase maturation factor HypF (carbamoyltransferase family)